VRTAQVPPHGVRATVAMRCTVAKHDTLRIFDSALLSGKLALAATALSHCTVHPVIVELGRGNCWCSTCVHTRSLRHADKAVRAALEEFVLDTRAYEAFWAKRRSPFVHYVPDEPSSISDSPASPDCTSFVDLTSDEPEGDCGQHSLRASDSAHSELADHAAHSAGPAAVQALMCTAHHNVLSNHLDSWHLSISCTTNLDSGFAGASHSRRACASAAESTLSKLGVADRRQEAYRLPQDVWQSVVDRMHARHGWRKELIQLWAAEMERFIALKALIKDSHATTISPSGTLDSDFGTGREVGHSPATDHNPTDGDMDDLQFDSCNMLL
jgi:hypothetical protein